jgi:hypothetical protein
MVAFLYMPKYHLWSQFRSLLSQLCLHEFALNLLLLLGAPIESLLESVVAFSGLSHVDP